jgi:hypothetical protein
MKLLGWCRERKITPYYPPRSNYRHNQSPLPNNGSTFTALTGNQRGWLFYVLSFGLVPDIGLLKVKPRPPGHKAPFPMCVLFLWGWRSTVSVEPLHEPSALKLYCSFLGRGLTVALILSHIMYEVCVWVSDVLRGKDEILTMHLSDGRSTLSYRKAIRTWTLMMSLNKCPVSSISLKQLIS